MLGGNGNTGAWRLRQGLLARFFAAASFSALAFSSASAIAMIECRLAWAAQVREYWLRGGSILCVSWRPVFVSRGRCLVRQSRLEGCHQKAGFCQPTQSSIARASQHQARWWVRPPAAQAGRPRPLSSHRGAPTGILPAAGCSCTGATSTKRNDGIRFDANHALRPAPANVLWTVLVLRSRRPAVGIYCPYLLLPTGRHELPARRQMPGSPAPVALLLPGPNHSWVALRSSSALGVKEEPEEGLEGSCAATEQEEGVVDAGVKR